MPGSNNRVQFANGYRLEASAAEEWQIMQATATDVSCVNNAGNPEGVVPANMGSLCHDRTNGDLYVKNTGTDEFGWVLISTGGSTTDLHTARFIVSAGGTTDGANYTDVPTAYAAAVAAGAPQTVFCQPGTYTFNQTLTPGINISAYACDAITPNVTFVGKLTLTTAGDVSISGIQLRTNADFAVSVTGTVASQLNLIGCKLDATDANAIQFTSSSGSSKIECFWCNGDLAATRAYFTHSGAGKLAFYNSVMENNDASTTAATLSGSGSCQILNSFFSNAITTSSTSNLQIRNCSYTGALIVGSTGASNVINNSTLIGGASSSLSVSAGATVAMSNCAVSSSNSNAITGAGILQYAGLSFISSSSTVNTTTQTVLNEGPSRLIGTATSGGTNTLTVTNSSNTASSNAAIVATVGGTSAADAYYQAVVSGTTTWSWGVDNSDSDAYVLSASATPGTTNVMRVSTAGEINYPLQPAFLAYVATTITNVTGDSTVYTIIYDTEVFDQNADFNLGTSTFTAPVTGRYYLNHAVLVLGGTTITSANARIVTSNRTYNLTIGAGASLATTNCSINQSVLADMDAADTMTITVTTVDSGGKIDDVSGTTSGDLRTWVSGYLVA